MDQDGDEAQAMLWQLADAATQQVVDEMEVDRKKRVAEVHAKMVSTQKEGSFKIIKPKKQRKC